LFTTLAWQLGASIPETLPYIELALKTERLLHTKSIDIQFDRLVVKVFENLLHDNPGLRPEKSLVIIDGVDECATEQHQKLFLKLIADALARTSIPLRFLICSRPEPHITETFDTDMKSVSCAVVIDEEFRLDNDIRRYLEDELFRIFTRRHVSPLPSDSDIQRLVSKASSQFIYASTVIRFIDDDGCNPREQLDIILNLHPVNSSSPYAHLDQLYIQILSQQSDIRFLREIFVLVIALAHPHLKFICRRRRISKEELWQKLGKMHSLLQISDEDIMTYHRSLNDLFRDKKRSGKYHIHPLRIALLRLPKIMKEEVYDLVYGLLLPARVLMTPLFVIPGIFYANRLARTGGTSVGDFIDFICLYPL